MLANAQSFKTEKIEQFESLEIRVLTPFRLKPKKGAIYIIKIGNIMCFIGYLGAVNHRGSCFRMAAGLWVMATGWFYV